VLKGILPDGFYCHYALLATSIYLLLQQPVTQAGLLLADKQLEEFYALMAIYYGTTILMMLITATSQRTARGRIWKKRLTLSNLFTQVLL